MQQQWTHILQGLLDDGISDINLEDVRKIAVYVTSDDTGETVPVLLSIVACIPEEPGMYGKVLKSSDIKKLGCNLPKIQTIRPNLRVFCQNKV